MSDKQILKLITDDKEIEYEILLAFYWYKTKKNYIVYTDNTKDKDNNLNVFASIFYPEDDKKLDDIETEEEWNEIEKRLNEIKEGVENE